MQTIKVPAEVWYRLATANCAGLAASQTGKGRLRPKTNCYNGFLYATFAAMYGEFGAHERPRLEAYRLLPESMWRGEKFETAKALSRRAENDESLRGSYLGLLVEVLGEPMVCAKEETFVMDLPRTKPMALEEAEKYEAKQRRVGWRSMFFRGAAVWWASLERHPVAVYENKKTGARRSALVWRDGKSTRDLIIGSEVPLGGKDVLRERELGDQLVLPF